MVFTLPEYLAWIPASNILLVGVSEAIEAWGINISQHFALIGFLVQSIRVNLPFSRHRMQAFKVIILAL